MNINPNQNRRKMIKIIKLIDELRNRLSPDYPEFIYEIIDNIEKEVRKPIKIFRHKKQYIFDVQPDFSYDIIDVEENEKKVINLAKLTE